MELFAPVRASDMFWAPYVTWGPLPLFQIWLKMTYQVTFYGIGICILTEGVHEPLVYGECVLGLGEDLE